MMVQQINSFSSQPDLPVEIWFGILKNLPPTTLSTLAKVSRFFRMMTADQQLWKFICFEKFNFIDTSSISDWKTYCIKRIVNPYILKPPCEISKESNFFYLHENPWKVEKLQTVQLARIFHKDKHLSGFDLSTSDFWVATFANSFFLYRNDNLDILERESGDLLYSFSNIALVTDGMNRDKWIVIHERDEEEREATTHIFDLNTNKVCFSGPELRFDALELSGDYLGLYNSNVSSILICDLRKFTQFPKTESFVDEVPAYNFFSMEERYLVYENDGEMRFRNCETKEEKPILLSKLKEMFLSQSLLYCSTEKETLVVWDCENQKTLFSKSGDFKWKLLSAGQVLEQNGKKSFLTSVSGKSTLLGESIDTWIAHENYMYTATRHEPYLKIWNILTHECCATIEFPSFDGLFVPKRILLDKDKILVSGITKVFQINLVETVAISWSKKSKEEADVEHHGTPSRSTTKKRKPEGFTNGNTFKRRLF